MVIFPPLAARSPQKPPGWGWRNKVLADRPIDPDDADKADDHNESDNSDDSDDSLMTSRASYPSCKKSSWPRFLWPGPMLRTIAAKPSKLLSKLHTRDPTLQTAWQWVFPIGEPLMLEDRAPCIPRNS